MRFHSFDFYDQLKLKPAPPLSLAEAIGFDEYDLEANRDGVLSERQHNRFRVEAWLRSAAMLIITLLLGFGAVFVLLVDSRAAVLLTLFAAIELIAYALVGAHTGKFRAEAEDRLAESVQGHIRLDVRAGGKNTVSFALNIGDERFDVNKAVFLAFKNDEPYVVYFGPHTHTLLSAEWLRDPTEV